MTMSRIEGLEPDKIAALRLTLQEDYAANEQPCPGTNLKINDHVMIFDVLPVMVLWGTDDPDCFFAYAPDLFGEMAANLDAHYITDRAPADPNETPMPIYPQQQFAQQPGARDAAKRKTHDQKEALRHLLKQLTPEYQKKVRALIKQKKPELLDEGHE